MLSPILLATALLATAPLRDAAISWPAAVAGTLFTTVLPWIMLAVARLRGRVSDMHVTRRSQRHWIYAATAGFIIAGLLVLWLLQAAAGMYREVLSILLGLAVVAAINLCWKVSVHLAVGTYVLLAVLAGTSGLMPLALVFLAVLSWARVRSGEHTASQVCGGVLVGVAVHYGAMALAAWLGQ